MSQSSLFPELEPTPAPTPAPRTPKAPPLFSAQLKPITITVTDISRLQTIRDAALKPGGTYPIEIRIGNHQGAEIIPLAARYRIDQARARALANEPFVLTVSIPK